ncbi:hypothetical protein SRHO_G00104330 [Serrasalmus rhombeus]
MFFQVGALIVSVIFSKPSKVEKQELRCGQQVHASALLQEPNRSRSHRETMSSSVPYFLKSSPSGNYFYSHFKLPSSSASEQKSSAALRKAAQKTTVGALIVSVIFSKPSKAEKQELRCGQKVHASVLLQERNRSCSHRGFHVEVEQI